LVKEFKDLQMEIYIKDLFKMISQAVTENIIGKIKVILKDIFRMDLEQGKDYGKKEQEIVISMKVNINTIRNGVMEYLLGQMEMYLKGIMKAI
jgi:hypothetical protein